MAVYVQKEAPDFTATAVVDEEFKTVKLSDYKGKNYVVLFFYPLDFTFVCPTEIIAFSDRIEEFKKQGPFGSERAYQKAIKEAGGTAIERTPLV